jgi:hypothetical protein
VRRIDLKIALGEVLSLPFRQWLEPVVDLRNHAVGPDERASGLSSQSLYTERPQAPPVVLLGQPGSAQIRRGDHTVVDLAEGDEVIDTIARVFLRQDIRVLSNGIGA